MDHYILEKRQLSLSQHRSDILAQLEALKQPLKRIAVVESWVEEHEALKWRYRFLVLSGPSMLGKTQFALGLACRSRGLELNCSSGKEPDLRQYDPLDTDLVLFDEMPASAIIGQKKLMQCPPALVTLGTSGTNAFAYKVWVHQKLFVISTNTWHEDLKKMNKGERDWLVANSVLVDVTAPLWGR